jgi:hypothetical protein
MNNDTDRSTLTPYMQDVFTNAERLADELAALGFPATITHDKDRDTIRVLIERAPHTYEVRELWKGEHTVARYPSPLYYDTLSHEKSAEIYKRTHTHNKVFKLSAKKLTALMNQADEYEAQMQEASDKASDKIAAYLARIESLKSLPGVTCTIAKDKTGGWLKRNGIELRFTVHGDGYISEHIEVRTDWREEGRDTVADFVALSDNEYRV